MIIRYLCRVVALFVFGFMSFFGLLIAIAAIMCLLAVGFTCALFTVWAMIHFGFYLAFHDHTEGRNALQAILVAAGCFAGIALTSGIVTDLFMWSRRPKSGLSLTFDENR